MTIIGNLVDGLETFRQLGAKEIHSRDGIIYAGNRLTEESLPDVVLRILERCEWRFNGSWWWFPLEEADQSAIEKEIELGSSASTMSDQDRSPGLFDDCPVYLPVQEWSQSNRSDADHRLSSRYGIFRIIVRDNRLISRWMVGLPSNC